MGWNFGEKRIGRMKLSITIEPIMKKNNERDKMAFVAKPLKIK